MQRVLSRVRNRKGFTLVELAVVIVIIGVLAAFGVPRFLQSVEKSKASEAFNYLSAIQGSEERYLAQNGVYASSISDLDVLLSNPQYFTVPSSITVTPDSAGNPAWALMLTPQCELELCLYRQLDATGVRHLVGLDNHELPADLPGDGYR